MTWWKPCSANGPRHSVLRQSFVSPTIKRRQCGRFEKQRMRQQMVHLPMPLPFGQAQVPMDQVQPPFGRVDHDHLGAARTLASQAERNLMFAGQRPARQDQVAVAAALQPHVRLMQEGDGMEIVGQHPRLIVKARAADVVIDFLQANQVGIFLLDDFDHPLEPVAAVAAADPFVNVVTEQPHVRWWQGSGRSSPADRGGSASRRRRADSNRWRRRRACGISACNLSSRPRTSPRGEAGAKCGRMPARSRSTGHTMAK